MADFRHKHEDADRDFRCGLEQLVRGHIDGCMTAALASCSSAADDDPSPDGPDLARRRRRSDLDGDDLAETSAAARRHSRILSRWVARQAEEMITTIERRNRESELMALAGLHTVSMLDSSFLREPGRGAAAQTVERPVSARGSSILQRWRELEDESAAQLQSTRIPPHSPTNRNAGQLERQASSEDASVSDATTEYSRWPPGAVAESDDDRTSTLEQSVGDGERERVRQIVRGWTVDSGTTDASSRVSRRSESPRAEWLGERERERVRLVREWVQTASQQRDARASGREERGHEVIQPIQPEQIQRDLPRLRGRQARLDLITRIAGERQRELQHLSEHRVVSDFTHRNRIQSLLRGRFLRNGRPPEDERQPSVAARELGQLRQRNPVSGLREGFRHRLENIVRGQANGHSGAPVLHNVNDTRNDHSQSNTVVEETIDERAQFQSRSENNEIHQTIRSENNEVHDEMTRSENIEVHQMTETHVTAGLQISSNNVGWQESVTQRENLREEDADNGRIGWQPSPEVEFSEWGNDNEEELDRNWNETTGEAWSREIPEDEDGGDSHILEPHEEWHEEESQRTLETWHHGPSPSQREEQSAPIRRINRFVPPDDDNVYSMELRELLSRRSVSNLLHSRFRESLDQLIQSYVQRQDRTTLDWDLQRTVDDPDSPDEDQSQHRDDLNQDQQESDARPPVVLSTPPVPPPQPLWHSEFHRGNWTRPSMHRSEIEWDISDLRADISRLQQGMNNMQRMLEACMDMQLELQRSVRQEVSAALNRSIGEQGAVEEVAVDGSKWAHVRKGTCCVCCDSHIDALLYRCGHMCTCSKCAHELVRSGDKCPLCRAPIAEVIRAYSIL